LSLLPLTTTCILFFFIPECIDLSSRLLHSSNQGGHHNHDDYFVHVWALSYVPNATQVHVEPCSSADWDLMQQNAAWLEGGGDESSCNIATADGAAAAAATGLLHQVSIVYPGQVLSLCVPPPPATASSRNHHPSRIRMVHLRVLSCSTGTSAKPPNDPIWPLLDDDEGDDDDIDDTPTHHRSQEQDDDNDDENAYCCFRLVRDTEVIVAPYQEKAQDESSSGLVFSLYPTMQDYHYADRDYNDNDNAINNDNDDSNGTAASAAAVVKGLAHRLRYAIGNIDNKDTPTSTATSRSQRQRPPQVSLLTSTTVPPFTALVHPTTLTRLWQQQQQQQQQTESPGENRDNNKGGELLVQLRAIPSGHRDIETSWPLMMVVQLQESNDVPEDRIGKFIRLVICIFALCVRVLFVCLSATADTLFHYLFREDPNHANTEAYNTSSNV
jgi:hypothetical protein